MTITSTCPGCGASLSIDENQPSITCQFCGNTFRVNLDETAPTLHKSSPPPTAPPVPDIPPAPSSEGRASAANEMYNPPIPGAPPTPREDVYNPPIEDILTGPGQNFTPPPFTAPAEPPLISRWTGNRLWVAIAIATTIIFCMSCLCMAAIARGLFQ